MCPYLSYNGDVKGGIGTVQDARAANGEMEALEFGEYSKACYFFASNRGF